MRPSELRASQEPRVESEQPRRPYSRLADPPISDAEAKAAKDAICCGHRGLIAVTGDRLGSVWFCPVGNQYWRYIGAHRVSPVLSFEQVPA
jgi:hypothetical protein